MENSKPLEQHRWPGRTQQVNLVATANLSSKNPSPSKHTAVREKASTN